MLSEEGIKRILLSYVVVIFLTGIASLIYIILKYRNISLLGVVVFGVLIFTSDNLSAPLPKTGSVSVNFGISLGNRRSVDIYAAGGRFGETDSTVKQHS